MKENLLCQFWQDCFKPQFYSLALRKLNLWRCKAICHLKYGCHTRHQMHHVEFISASKKAAFSLVEMLMALLVASLLLAALAPVMTKKMNETLTVNGSMTPKGVSKKIEINFNSNSPENHFRCDEIKEDTDGSKYCEGEYVVPADYNGAMKVTVIGAGGGGGTAPTAGYTEFTTAGSTNNFTVPAMINRLEATLVSGGAGGGGGGQVTKTQTFVTYGNGNITADANNVVTVNSSGTGNWTIPTVARGKNIIASACGGGGGGGSTMGTWHSESGQNAFGGGSGGYVLNKVITFASANSFTYYVGGGGAGAYGAYKRASFSASNSPKNYGGGGSGEDNSASLTSLRIAAPGGGDGGAHWTEGFIYDGHPTLPPTNGVYITTSDIGGMGGIGSPNGPTVSGSTTYNFKMVAGSGGQPGGGGGAILHYGGCYGGSGGGGGGASQIVVGSGIFLNAPGGGGGSGSLRKTAVTSCPANSISSGGGGGGTGGGGGGGASFESGRGGTGGANGSGYNGGNVSTIFGSDYCNGGRGGLEGGTDDAGYGGKSGAIRLTYLDYGTGASGGGAGQIVPIQPVNVTPQETLTVLLGRGAPGGRAGSIETTGAIKSPTKGDGSTTYNAVISKLFRGSTLLLTTSPISGAYNGTAGGCPSGEVSGGTLPHDCGNHGRVSTGNPNTITTIKINGFVSHRGNSAGNTPIEDKTGFPPKSAGGDGGKITLFNLENHCTVGKGGTSSSINGTNATGYGCGGGGGYGLADGGAGSGGYARLSWNMYWDSTVNSYKYADIGSGGGGASGNTMTYTLNVIGGQTIKIRIGQGGTGARVTNNTIIPAASGGTTIFGDSAFGEIKAGGGGGGNSPSVNNSNAFINGTGGSISNVCHYKSRSYLNNTNYCKKGNKGNAPLDNSTVGGAGANFVFSNISGTGGAGGRQDSGDNSKGSNAEGYGSGGGGAAIRKFSGSVPTGDVLNNPNIGGNGGNGKIIIEWWE